MPPTPPFVSAPCETIRSPRPPQRDRAGENGKNRRMVTAVTLNTGYSIPQLGLGTYKMSPEEARRSVAYALSLGYRHIDTAQMYHNEEGVGAGIKDSGVPREDIFLTTKLDNPNHAPERVRETFAESLEKLGTDYVDLFLIHWPLLTGDFVDSWKVMEELVARGQIRSIGVSNFEPHHLAELAAASSTVPAINQIEIHPYFHNSAAVEATEAAGAVVEAWSPLARGLVLDDAVLTPLAAAHGVTVSQLVLAWHMAKGYVVFPKSTHEERIKENFAAANVTLNEEEITAIDALDKGEAGRTGMHPDTMQRRH